MLGAGLWLLYYAAQECHAMHQFLEMHHQQAPQPHLYLSPCVTQHDSSHYNTHPVALDLRAQHHRGAQMHRCSGA